MVRCFLSKSSQVTGILFLSPFFPSQESQQYAQQNVECLLQSTHFLNLFCMFGIGLNCIEVSPRDLLIEIKTTMIMLNMNPSEGLKKKKEY